MLIDLPDYRQTEEWDCGRVVLRIICDHWGRTLPLFIANLSNSLSGLSPDTLDAAFWSLGFKVLSGSGTVGLLKAATKEGCPVVVLHQSDGVGHWSVCRGVERGRVYLQCPSEGRISIPTQQFVDEWIDFHFMGSVYDRWMIVPTMGV
jgi:ABC-type bacteriocin/lantibiotic exporter with double-glycine peptidase domain